MSFISGTSLGHYRILESIGAGGMGEVFKATDTKLDRPVALKVLPAHLVTDLDRVRRFVGEAKAASALNHPNIITIYEIGEVDGEPAISGNAANTASLVHYIAMEYVSGTTLHAKIHRERTELKRLLGYFAQSADGLGKAHAAGIIHRDLKPENIMITEDGYAKILDFGLAKLVEPTDPGQQSSSDLEEAATAVMDKTRPGVVMGTVGYMSPEQAQGKPVDQRSDIFSFGCMLYEAATAQKPFQGDSMIDSLHKIVYGQTPLIRDANPSAPAELQRIIRKCLAKDPGERYQSIKDVAIDLRDLIKEYDSQPTVSGVYVTQPTETQSGASITVPPVAPPSVTGTQPAVTASNQAVASGAVSAITESRKAVSRGLLVVLAFVVLAAIGVVLYLFLGPKHSKLTGPAFENTTLTKLTTTGKAQGAVISPDGKYVVHVLNEAGKQGLWMRQTAIQSNVPIVPADEVIYTGMTFSHDGNYVYFVKGEKTSSIRSLFQVPVLGGSPKKLIEDVDSPISFSPDAKRFVFVRHSRTDSSLITANADGTDEQKLLTYQQPDIFTQPVWSPDGKVIAASTRKVSGGFRNEVIAVQVSDGAEKTIGTQKWLGIGGLSWLEDSSGIVLCAVDQTPGSRRLQIWQLSYPDGKARRITNDLNNYSGVSLSADSSTLVTVKSDAVANLWLVPGGDAGRAHQITSGSGRYDQLSFVPDGRLIYLTDASGTGDIWIMDADGKNPKQLTSDAGVNVFPAVSPDGRYIVFDSNRTGDAATFNVWRMGIDGSNAKQITQGEGEYFPTCSADGKWIVYTPFNGNSKFSLWKIPIDGGDGVQLTDRISLRPEVSPDGKWVAAQSSGDEPGSGARIAIFAFEGGPATKLLNLPVAQFRWSSDSKSILYLYEKDGISNIWSKVVDGDTPAKAMTNFTTDQIFSFDWSRDGKQMACSRGYVTTDVILIKDQKRQDGK
jgi:eukaryotic-like serine/threonine-protein kinase